MLRRFLLLTLLLAGALPAGFAQAMTIEGHAYDTKTKVAGNDLVLNGVGVRAVAWLKGFTAGLYLPARAASADAVIATAGAKRLQLRMMQNAPAQEFVKAIDKGITRNTPADRQPVLADRKAAFEQQVGGIGNVKKGDVVNLDFEPGRGLQLTLNGKARGQPIPGDDFYAAVLRIFLGDRPVDARLKEGLLGRATGGPAS